MRIVVFASGRGSNFEGLARAISGGSVAATIPALVTDHQEAPCALRARELGIGVVCMPALGRRRSDYDRDLAERIKPLEPDYIFLLGWMRLLTMNFISHFPNKIVNLHPALPGAFPGIDAIKRAHEAGRRGEIVKTGAMLHLVSDEGVDSGPILLAEELPLDASESLESLEERMHLLEIKLVVELAARLGREKPLENNTTNS